MARPTKPERFVCPGCGGRKSRGSSVTCHECYLKGRRAKRKVRPGCPECGRPISPLASVCDACYRSSLENADRPFPIGGGEAARYGVIVTLQNDSGERLTVHECGDTVRKCIRACYETATAKDPSFLILSVSTPTSVFTDITQKRPHGGFSPESASGLGEMLHPSLRRSNLKATA